MRKVWIEAALNGAWSRALCQLDTTGYVVWREKSELY
jgi:hypothetical protein